MSKKAIVPGSLSAVAKQDGQSLAESFLSADAIVIVDVSGSMGARDVDKAVNADAWETGPQTGRTRYQAACDELTKLQAQLPGKVAVIAFSSSVKFCPGGVPPLIGLGTDLEAALKFVHAADDTGVRFIVISDGGPDDPEAALTQARRFVSAIDTVYIGPEGGAGAKFLARLAKDSGGQASATQIPQLAERLERLMLAPGA